jgi:hypothetical protein
VSGFLEIVDVLEARGWQRSAFWPHGGHLFAAHVVSGLGLGGTEVNPFCFAPFGGLPDGAVISDGHVVPFEAPGIGWEHKADAWRLFSSLS